VDLGTFDLSEALEEVVELGTPAALARGMEPITLLDSALPRGLTGFHAEITEAFSGLLAHALIRGGGGDLVVRAESDAREMEVSVAYPEPAAHPAGAHGGGPGSSAEAPLAHAETIAARFGGKVTAEGEGPGRAVLRLIIPAAASRPPAGSSPPRLDARVLVHDPHPLAERSVRNRLLALGASVTVARSPAQARQVLERAAFDLAIAGFPAVQVRSGAMEELLRDLRARYAGPVLALAGVVPFRPPPALARDREIRWVTRPVRRSVLEQVLRDLGSRPSRREAPDAPRHRPRPRRPSPMQDPIYQSRLKTALLQEIGKLEAEARDEHRPAVAELAHRINGLAAYAGQPELRSTALGIERAVREGDLPRLRDALDRLSALAVDLRPGD
jgi:hypothetical protein